MALLRWSERAIENLAEIAGYVSELSPNRVAGVIARLTHAVSLLQEHPELGKPAYGVTVRELVVRPYRVFYRFRRDCVEILTIVHGRRDSY